MFFTLLSVGTVLSDPRPADSDVKSVEQEYDRLLEADDAALKQVDQWIRESERPDADKVSSLTLQGRIRQRLKPLREAYEAFLQKHPDHAKAHLAYASFLTDSGDEKGALPHLMRATELAPKDPAAWNNLANYYGHNGDVKKAFRLYEKAIALNPKEAVYYHNFGTAVFLFRRDVREVYAIKEEAVFDKALGLYAKALERDPKNFDLAEDIAQTYYGIRTQDVPSRLARPQAAIQAWNYALGVAPSAYEKQGVYLHLARIHIGLGDIAEARSFLAKVDLPVYRVLKQRLTRNLERKEHPAAETAGAETKGDGAAAPKPSNQ